MTENRAQPLTDAEERLTLTSCLHRRREFVGSDHGAIFQRCLLCRGPWLTSSPGQWELLASFFL